MSLRLCSKYTKTICLKNLYSTSSLLNSTEYSNSTENKNTSQTNVDRTDVEKHSKLKNEWWDINGPLKALHSMNSLRVPLIRDGLVNYALDERTSTPLIDKKILDIGCGGGILSEPLAVLGAKVTGVDASAELISVAQQHAAASPRLANNMPEYICSTIEEHAKTDNKYDGVVASEIIEHIDNKESFVKSCINTLKPGGRIFFTTLNRTRASQLGGICLAEYVLNIVPKGTHQYEKFITPTELTFLLERNSCLVEGIYGTFYHFLTNRWQWTDTQMFMYALQAVKLDV